MIKIILEPADNGVIKIIKDDNINGAGESHEEKFVYEMKNNISDIKRFVFDLLDDLAIETGGKFSQSTIKMIEDWGSEYEPTKKQIEKKIKDYQTEISYLENKLN
jgi:cob(I)alamin adenosyltransferase